MFYLCYNKKNSAVSHNTAEFLSHQFIILNPMKNVRGDVGP